MVAVFGVCKQNIIQSQGNKYMISLNYAFSTRVREKLKEKKMTQYKLEQLTGIYHSTMNAIMNNRCKSSNFKTMAIIIKELGMNIPEFFNSPIFANFDNLDIE